MKVPCKECLTLSVCKNLDLHHLIRKCSSIKIYLKVEKVSERRINPTEYIYRMYSDLKPFIHRIRLNRLKHFVHHTYKIN
jgi:hypothetical protein